MFSFRMLLLIDVVAVDVVEHVIADVVVAVADVLGSNKLCSASCIDLSPEPA